MDTITGAWTVICELAVSPFTVVAVIHTVPAPRAVTTPCAETIATLVSLECHVTAWIGCDGTVVALRPTVSLGLSVALAGQTVMLVG